MITVDVLTRFYRRLRPEKSHVLMSQKIKDSLAFHFTSTINQKVTQSLQES
jgi:hypothetical protein